MSVHIGKLLYSYTDHHDYTYNTHHRQLYMLPVHYNNHRDLHMYHMEGTIRRRIKVRYPDNLYMVDIPHWDMDTLPHMDLVDSWGKPNLWVLNLHLHPDMDMVVGEDHKADMFHLHIVVDMGYMVDWDTLVEAEFQAAE